MEALFFSIDELDNVGYRGPAYSVRHQTIRRRGTAWMDLSRCTYRSATCAVRRAWTSHHRRARWDTLHSIHIIATIHLSPSTTPKLISHQPPQSSGTRYLFPFTNALQFSLRPGISKQTFPIRETGLYYFIVVNCPDSQAVCSVPPFYLLVTCYVTFSTSAHSPAHGHSAGQHGMDESLRLFER